MTGTVVFSEIGDYDGGNFVVVEYDSFWLGTGEKMRASFLHMAYAPEWDVGDIIRKDDVIGYVGSTGDSTGPHLHLAVFTNQEKWPDERYTINPERLFPWVELVGDTSTVRP